MKRLVLFLVIGVILWLATGAITHFVMTHDMSKIR